VRGGFKQMGIRPGGFVASVQGFGKVAQYAIQLF